jgi:ligand-binding sensor domain-containing protein
MGLIIKTKSLKFLGVFSIFLLAACNQPIAPISKPRGPQWVVFHPSNSPLVSDTINAVIVNISTFWIATDKGANSLHNGNWQTFTAELRYDTPLGKSSRVNAITIGTDQSVWFGLAGGGVMRMNLFTSSGPPWAHYTTPDITSDFVFALATDKAGDIYATTSSGVSRFFSNGSRWFKYGSGNSPIPDEPIRSAGFDPFTNTIWFGTNSQGVVSYDGDLNWNVDTPSEQPFPIISMAFSPLNTIWFGTFADWAYKYSTATFEWTHVADSASGGGLKGNFVNAVAVELNGTVWFGTNNGLTRLTGATWSTFSRFNSTLPSDTVTSLTFDINGNLWIGTGSGLAEYNEGGTVQ